MAALATSCYENMILVELKLHPNSRSLRKFWQGIIMNDLLHKLIARRCLSIAMMVFPSVVLAQGISSPARMRLDQVQSFLYLIAATTDEPGLAEKVATSNTDMFIFSGASFSVPVDRARFDPTGRKLLLASLNVGEAVPYWYPQLKVNGQLPSWFGGVNPAFPDLYTVQYWNSAWRPVMYSVIEKALANGYDGIFLDVLSADSQWAPSNAMGNPVHPSRVADLADLVADIRAHIKKVAAGRTFHVIGNNPFSFAIERPDALKHLDAAFHECFYFCHHPTDGTRSIPLNPLDANFFTDVLLPAYRAAGIIVFGNDYPVALTETADLVRSLSSYANNGVVSSVTRALQNSQTMMTGPVVMTASITQPRLEGRDKISNFLLGGNVDKPVIRGGDADDHIIPHRTAAAAQGKLEVRLSALNLQSTVPSVAIVVNGQTRLGPIQVTANSESNAHSLVVDIGDLSSIDRIEVVVSGTFFTSPSQFSNVNLHGLRLHGESIDLRTGLYSSGQATNASHAFSNNGLVAFPATALPKPSPLTQAADVDGGPGFNTVYYPGRRADYRMEATIDSAWNVSGRMPAEGTDLLKNVQKLVFADQTLAIKPLSQISMTEVGNFGAFVLPDIFYGPRQTGRSHAMDFVTFTATGNSLAKDDAGQLWGYGPITNNSLVPLGPLGSFAADILSTAASR